MREENTYIYIYIYRVFNIYFQIATFFKMGYIFIVFFLDGKIADRQTNNSSNSLIQSRNDFFLIKKAFNRSVVAKLSHSQISPKHPRVWKGGEGKIPYEGQQG